MNRISASLWFDNEAEEAARFYARIFPDSRIKTTTHYTEEGSKVSGRPPGSAMTVTFNLEGYEFMALNGGPMFRINESISFFVYRKTESEIDELYKKLSPGGKVLMPLGKYPFSKRYAFFKDKFGVAWQLMLSDTQHTLTPCLLFVGESLGKAEKAVNYYTSIFPKSKIENVQLYGPGEPGKEGSVMHAAFQLNGQDFTAMDGTGSHEFKFNEAVSFVVTCKNQKEIDDMWSKLAAQGEEGQCGWLKDKFGVSWQVVPAVLSSMLKDKYHSRVQRVTAAFLKMKKFNIAELEEAFEGR